jgi:hypothetical protein
VRKDEGIPGFGDCPSQLMSSATQGENEGPAVWGREVRVPGGKKGWKGQRRGRSLIT